jgi:hypothetical protein
MPHIPARTPKTATLIAETSLRPLEIVALIESISVCSRAKEFTAKKVIIKANTNIFVFISLVKNFLIILTPYERFKIFAIHPRTRPTPTLVPATKSPKLKAS